MNFPSNDAAVNEMNAWSQVEDHTGVESVEDGENDSQIMKSEFQRLPHEKATMGEKIEDNLDKIENNGYDLSGYPVFLGAGAFNLMGSSGKNYIW